MTNFRGSSELLEAFIRTKNRRFMCSQCSIITIFCRLFVSSIPRPCLPAGRPFLHPPSPSGYGRAGRRKGGTKQKHSLLPFGGEGLGGGAVGDRGVVVRKA